MCHTPEVVSSRPNTHKSTSRREIEDDELVVVVLRRRTAEVDRRRRPTEAQFCGEIRRDLGEGHVRPAEQPALGRVVVRDTGPMLVRPSALVGILDEDEEVPRRRRAGPRAPPRAGRCPQRRLGRLVNLSGRMDPRKLQGQIHMDDLPPVARDVTAGRRSHTEGAPPGVSTGDHSCRRRRIVFSEYKPEILSVRASLR